MNCERKGCDVAPRGSDGSVGLMEFRKCGREISGISGTVSFFHDAAAILIVHMYSGFIRIITVVLISPTHFQLLIREVDKGQTC